MKVIKVWCCDRCPMHNREMSECGLAEGASTLRHPANQLPYWCPLLGDDYKVVISGPPDVYPDVYWIEEE